MERYYEISSGDIFIGGLNIKDLNIFYQRSIIGYVAQEPMLFNTSIRENILLGRTNVSEEQIKTACDLSNVTEFLSRYRKWIGYDCWC